MATQLKRMNDNTHKKTTTSIIYWVRQIYFATPSVRLIGRFFLASACCAVHVSMQIRISENEMIESHKCQVLCESHYLLPNKSNLPSSQKQPVQWHPIINASMVTATNLTLWNICHFLRFAFRINMNFSLDNIRSEEKNLGKTQKNRNKLQKKSQSIL